jgi:isopenicillin N synthase-like dioxygenase
LEVVNASGEWIPAPPIEGTFVVNFGNAFEAATDGAVKATIHRVKVINQTDSSQFGSYWLGICIMMDLCHFCEVKY